MRERVVIPCNELTVNAYDRKYEYVELSACGAQSLRVRDIDLRLGLALLERLFSDGIAVSAGHDCGWTLATQEGGRVTFAH